jgi:uncharacterized OB-fold protein
MMSKYNKPLPVASPDSQPFWDGCKKHELLIPRCQRCGSYHFFPRFFCPKCLSTDLEWSKSGGRGTIYTFTIIDRAGMAAFEEDVPYILALVQLEEGVRMMSNIVQCRPEEIAIGMNVQVFFDDVTEEITLPKFRPWKES